MQNSVAEGRFEVSTPLQDSRTEEGTTLSRLGLDKVFRGGLEGESHGEMLAAGVESGSGVYVAIERVKGKLGGRQGGFVLYHLGTRTSDEQALSVRILPDSGTGELAGISGELQIEISGEEHRYRLTYLISE